MLLQYLRLRRLGLLNTLTVVLVIAATVLASLISLNVVEGGILLAVFAALTALAPQALKWFGEQGQQIREEESLLRITRPISEVDPFDKALVFPSDLAKQDYPDQMPPYVRRDADTALDEALKTHRFVLITGASKAGKSRTAFEAVRRMKPEPTLLVPDSAKDFAKLLDTGLPVKRSRPNVLWLDDLDRYLKGFAMSRGRFENLVNDDSDVVILATITKTARRLLLSGEGEIGRSTREILDLFERINLSNSLSLSEREEAECLYPSQTFDAGIGEHFAAARELTDLFDDAMETHPHGFAVVVAALDWRRAGMSRPIRETELRDLYAVNLKRFSPLLEANDKDYQGGMEWAREQLESGTALLMPTTSEGVEGFEVFDYIRDWTDRADNEVDERLHTVPESIWDFVISRADSSEVIDVGFAAFRRGSLGAVETAWNKAADSGHAEYAPLATFNLGTLLRGRGDYERAAENYQQAINSGYEPWALKAMGNLGALLQGMGDYERAAENYQRAIDSGHAKAAPLAAVQLQRLHSSRSE